MEYLYSKTFRFQIKILMDSVLIYLNKTFCIDFYSFMMLFIKRLIKITYFELKLYFYILNIFIKNLNCKFTIKYLISMIIKCPTNKRNFKYLKGLYILREIIIPVNV
jgi:hypothetical protein